VRGLNSLNYNYLKLKKEEVIYKVRFIHKYRVLPLHTACASRASARDHVTWNARTVTHLFKIRGERTLLINLLYNLALSNLKKFKELFKLILVNLL